MALAPGARLGSLAAAGACGFGGCACGGSCSLLADGSRPGAGTESETVAVAADEGESGIGR